MKCCRAATLELQQEIGDLQIEFDTVIGEVQDIGTRIEATLQAQEQLRATIEQRRRELDEKRAELIRIYEGPDENELILAQRRQLQELDQQVAENKRVIAQQKYQAQQLQEKNAQLTEQLQAASIAKDAQEATKRAEQQAIYLSSPHAFNVSSTGTSTDYYVLRQKMVELKEGLDAQLQIMQFISRKFADE